MGSQDVKDVWDGKPYVPSEEFKQKLTNVPPLVLSSYIEVYSVIYDSGSVPGASIFSPRETSPNPESATSLQFHMQTLTICKLGFN